MVSPVPVNEIPESLTVIQTPLLSTSGGKSCNVTLMKPLDGNYWREFREVFALDLITPACH